MTTQRWAACSRTTIAGLLLVALLTLSGCSALEGILTFFGFAGGTSTPESPEALIMSAMEDFNRARYSRALKTFDEIKERFPFSQHSLLAELKAADSNYHMDKYAEAIVLYEEFLSRHPTNEAAPYVMFQAGMCYYGQIDTIDRDPGAASDAIEAFDRLLRNFPETPYTEEAKARRLAARNFLANHEFYVAWFYIRTKEYDQARSRLDFLALTYPETTIAAGAKTIAADIEAGNPPTRSWRDWIPDISLPDWKTFTAFSKPGAVVNQPSSE